MRKETADLVLPILRHALRLKDRLRLGEKCSMATEQTELRRLFRSSKETTAAAEAGDVFLGIRYPLACWLDEIFIMHSDSPWKKEWNEQKMETALFRTLERATWFWKQAHLAATLGDVDALEVFYLCVMLGFRGDKDKPEDINELLDWREAAEGRIGQGRLLEWPNKPQELPIPETNASPLTARERLRWMLITGAVVLGLAVEATVVLLMRQF